MYPCHPLPPVSAGGEWDLVNFDDDTATKLVTMACECEALGRITSELWKLPTSSCTIDVASLDEPDNKYITLDQNDPKCQARCTSNTTSCPLTIQSRIPDLFLSTNLPYHPTMANISYRAWIVCHMCTINHSRHQNIHWWFDDQQSVSTANYQQPLVSLLNHS